jgi:hypothetical protein
MYCRDQVMDDAMMAAIAVSQPSSAKTGAIAVVKRSMAIRARV